MLRYRCDDSVGIIPFGVKDENNDNKVNNLL